MYIYVYVYVYVVVLIQDEILVLAPAMLTLCGINQENVNYDCASSLPLVMKQMNEIHRCVRTLRDPIDFTVNRKKKIDTKVSQGKLKFIDFIVNKCKPKTAPKSMMFAFFPKRRSWRAQGIVIFFVFFCCFCITKKKIVHFIRYIFRKTFHRIS